MSDLLPPNATPLERNLATTGERLDDLPMPIRDLRNPQRCPAALLPYLAWELSVDEWNPGWGEGTKRRVIAESVSVHRRKGTRGSVRRALEAILGDVPFTIIEGVAAGYYDGSKPHDGHYYYGRGINWARYSVIVALPLSRSQADSVRRTLAAIAPARCQLLALDFVQAANAYDGTLRYDNTYTHGVA